MASTASFSIKRAREKLLAWFETNGRSFPWRKSGLSSYQLVIAEVLLQRTRAETVSGFYSFFIARFPTWGAIACASLPEVKGVLKPVGLYHQRAVRLKKLATEMVKRKGAFPRDRKELESIPFLGKYIANAVELLIFGIPSPLLDVNMTRVLERYFGKRQMADIRYDPYLQALATEFVTHPSSKKINWAVLDFASLVCKARKPLCPSCPINRKCLYYEHIELVHTTGKIP